jgi:hypothetical protein
MTANPGTRVCAITLVCSESYKFILVRKFLRLFVSFINYNVRGGFQKYLHIFLHNLLVTQDTLNRRPERSSWSSVHFTPLKVSIISAFSSRNLAVANQSAWAPSALRSCHTSPANLKYFIEAFTVWTLSIVPFRKQQLKCNVFILIFKTPF